MKLAIWAKSPSPHQEHFYAALRRAGIDLQVRYLSNLRKSRRDLGWTQADMLSVGESVLPSGGDPLSSLPDWRRRIHVVPGYSRAVYRKVAIALSAANIPWTHWSERSQPSWRSPITWPIKHWYARLVNRCALGAFAQGNLAADDFQRWGMRKNKIAHLYYAIAGFGPEEPLDAVTADFVNGRTTFIYVGTISRAKASPTLIEAFSRVAWESNQVALVLAGAGPQVQQCREKAKRAKIEDKVLFRGVVPISQIGSVLKCCQVLIQPSLYDGWGVVLNEGASAGLALVASDRVGAAYHLIEHQRNGFRVQGGSTASLARAMHCYANDRRLAATHGEHSYELFQRFTPAANVDRFMNAIRSWLLHCPQWASFRREWGAGEEIKCVQSSAA